MKDWGSSCSHTDSSQFSKVCPPHKLPVHVVCIKPFRTKEGKDMFAVGRRSGCSEGTLTMAVIERGAFECCLLPEDLACSGIKADDFKGVLMIGSDAIGMQKLLLPNHMFDGLSARHKWAFNCGGEEYLVTPNYWRRMGTTGNRSLPSDVLRCTPNCGQVLFSRNALAIGTSPLRPVASVNGGVKERKGSKKRDYKCDAYATESFHEIFLLLIYSKGSKSGGLLTKSVLSFTPWLKPGARDASWFQ